jgi:hypothetical protein
MMTQRMPNAQPQADPLRRAWPRAVGETGVTWPRDVSQTPRNVDIELQERPERHSRRRGCGGLLLAWALSPIVPIAGVRPVPPCALSSHVGAAAWE